MSPKNPALPTVLVREVLTNKPFFPGEEPAAPYTHWHVFLDRTEAMTFVKNAERGGFGQEYEKAEYTLYKINLEGGETIVPPHVTVLDVAVEFGGDGVRIALYGKGRDAAAVFWDTHSNSFVVVKPDENMTGDKRYVSDQGVVLVSINGIGEIRWMVPGSQAQWNENKEATAHFGLTWTNG